MPPRFRDTTQAAGRWYSRMTVKPWRPQAWTTRFACGARRTLEPACLSQKPETIQLKMGSAAASAASVGVLANRDGIAIAAPHGSMPSCGPGVFGQAPKTARARQHALPVQIESCRLSAFVGGMRYLESLEFR